MIMSFREIFRNINSSVLKLFLSAKGDASKISGEPKNVLVIRQHNQFGDMLASVSLFRAIKETYPQCRVTLIAGPENFYAVEKNNLIDNLFVFEKKKFFAPQYFSDMRKILKQNYDLAVVPATVAVSATSCLLAALSDAKIKIGPKSLDGKINELNYVFNHKVDLNWKKCPDAHVSDFILDVLRPLGIKTKNFGSVIDFDSADKESAENFLESLNIKPGEYVIGFHIGAGKPNNRWALEKFIKLIYMIMKEFPIKIYFTGSDADREEINYVQSNLSLDAGYFLNRKISELAALISQTDIFITNDTGVMHVAGTTPVPQISIFGPTNPFNWAPVGAEKYFLKKSELVNDVSEEDVFNLCKFVLDKKRKKQ